MSGVITSPNHPDPYPNGIECVWNIRCPEDRGLLILIPNISIPLTMDCSDHLIMRENASPFSRTTYYACESYDNPVAFISRSKDLYIKFTSKSNNEMAEGFKIFYVTFEGRLFVFFKTCIYREYFFLYQIIFLIYYKLLLIGLINVQNRNDFGKGWHFQLVTQAYSEKKEKRKYFASLNLLVKFKNPQKIVSWKAAFIQ